MDYAKLVTEQRCSLSENLDRMSTLEAARLMNSLDALIPQAVEKALPEIASAAEVIAHAFGEGGRLIYCGAGTSGRLGVLDASECPPTFGVSSEQVVGIIAGGDRALRLAVEGAEDNVQLAEEDLHSIRLTPQDVVVAISASGSAPYCVGALKYAQQIGAYPIAVSCVASPVMGEYCRISIKVVVGPEVLAGSTRLRAGTATKLVLNMLSTLAMVRCGKVYKNYMVDVRPSNKKLRARAVRIISETTGVDSVRAAQVLATCADNVKAAIVSIQKDVSYQEALVFLEQSKGFVRGNEG